MPDNYQVQLPGDADAILRLIADTTPAMLAYFDADTQICRFAKARYAAHFGLTSQSIVGRSAREIVGDPAWEQISAQLEPLTHDASQVRRYTRQVQTASGGVQHIETVLRPHVSDGALKGVVSLMTDVSHHLEVQQQMRDSEERMRKFAALTSEAIVLHRDGIIIDWADSNPKCNTRGFNE